MTTGFCHCQVGKSCGPCKHKSAIAHHKGNAGFSVIPSNDPHMKAMWHYIAVGNTQPDYMYHGDDNTEVINVKKFIAEKIAEAQIDVIYEPNIQEHSEIDDIEDDREDDRIVIDEIDIEKFITSWRNYRERVVNEMSQNRQNYDFFVKCKECDENFGSK